MRLLAPLAMVAALISLATPASAGALRFDPAWLGQPFATVMDQAKADWRPNTTPLRRADPWIAERYASWAGIAFDAHLQGEYDVVNALVLYNVRDIAKDACEADYIALLVALEAEYGYFHWTPVEPEQGIVRVGVSSDTLIDHSSSPAEPASGGFVGRAQATLVHGESAVLIDLTGDYIDDACALIIAFSGIRP